MSWRPGTLEHSAHVTVQLHLAAVNGYTPTEISYYFKLYIGEESQDDSKGPRLTGVPKNK